MIAFQLLLGTDIYLPADEVGTPGAARLGFLFADTGAHGDTFELSEDTWMEGFVAFFVPSLERDWASFAEQLRGVFSENDGARLGWFSEDNDTVSPASLMYVDGSRELSQNFVTVLKGNVTLNLPFSPFTPINVHFDDTTNQFIIAKGSGLVPANLINVNALGGRQELNSTGTELVVPMTGQQRGGVGGEFQMSLTQLATFEAGLMYFGPPDGAGGFLTALTYPVFLPKSGGSSGTFNFAMSLDVLEPLSGTRSFFLFGDAEVDSYLTTSLGRPYGMSVAGAMNGDVTNASRLVFARRPLNDVSQDDYYYLTPAGSFSLTNGPDSGASGTPDEAELLCGVYGTEFLNGISALQSAEAVGGAPDTVTFVPEQPAYRKPQPKGEPVEDNPTYLTPDVTTSWLQFSTSTGKYVSQPPKSPLYQQPDKPPTSARAAVDPVANLLGFLPLPAWSTPGGTAAVTPLAPLAPYAGIQQDASDPDYLASYQVMEEGALNPTRKNAFLFHGDNTALLEADPDLQSRAALDESQLAMTPQGVLAVLKSGVWKGMQIAKSPSGILQFTEMQQQIRQVMQQNQIFAVITNLADDSVQHAKQYFEFADNDQTVEISEWFFGLTPTGTPATPPEGDEIPPILLLKFYPGKSIAELVDDTSFWSQPNTFNTTYTAKDAQAYLKKKIQDACVSVYGKDGQCQNGAPTKSGAQPDTSSIYYNFYEMITDPNFSGVLSVNCNLELSKLPTAIKAVTGGMLKTVKGGKKVSNIQAFRAHHVGVSINDTDPQAATPELVQSSFFALVDYEKPEPESDDDNGSDANALATIDAYYGFEVEYLRALFTNSELRDFSCKLNLTIDNLFDVNVNLDDDAVVEGAESVDDKGNVINIIGSYQSPAGSGTGMYSFVAEKDFKFTFTDNPYLKEITLTKIQYSFLTESVTGTADTSRIDARFAIWGSMVFKELHVLDLFSFEKLVFGDLGIDVAFDLTIPKTGQPSTSNLGLEFNPGNLRLDLGQTKKKGGDRSLLSLLPFKLKSFLYSQHADQTLESLDYIGLSSVPGLRKVGDTFNFALAFDLDLGSLGALVGSLEAFKFGAIIGWRSATSTKDGGIAFGLKMPEADGKLEINIEGVLKLVIQKLIIKYTNDPTQPGSDDNLLVVGLWCSYLELLGVRLPPDQKDKQGFFNFALFAPTGHADKLGWFAALDYTGEDCKKEKLIAESRAALPAKSKKKGTGGEGGDDDAVFVLDYLGGGQRVGPSKDDTPQTFDKFLEWMQNDFQTAFTTGKYATIYQPDGKWLMISKFELLKLINVGFIFYDSTPFYSLKLDVEKLFNFEITYTKISDTIGLFYANFALPDTLRTFQVGAASLTLPSIGVSVYTNGNWKLDVGFPKGDDWSRCFRVQAQAGPIPVTGSGGFYLASLSSATTDVFSKPPFDPSLSYPSIISFGFALRVGVGKDFTSGPLRAGISVTFFGIIEGSAGYLTAGSTDIFSRPDALALKGQVGLIGEIYGSIDFVIITASVNITLQASVGVEILMQIGGTASGEANGAILLYVQASVKVSLRVSINLGLFKIHVSVSFHASFRFEFLCEVGSQQQSRMIATDSMLYVPASANVPLFPGLANNKVTVWFAPELTVAFPNITDVGVPWLTLTLTTQYDEKPQDIKPDTLKPFETVAAQMAGWALISAIDSLTGWDSEIPLSTGNQTSPGLKEIDSDPTLLTGWITYDTILDQLKLFEFDVMIPQGAADATEDKPTEAYASVFPMFPFLQLATDGRKSGESAADLNYVFASKNSVSDAYIQSLKAYFDQLYVNQTKGSGGLSGEARDTATTPLIQGVFLDYFQGLVRATVHQLLQTMEDSGETSMPLDKLILAAVNKGNFVSLAGQMSNSFRGGARLPKTDGLTLPSGAVQDTNPLYSLLWQMFPVVGFGEAPNYTVTLNNTDAGMPWVNTTVRYSVEKAEVEKFSDFKSGDLLTPSQPEQLPFTRTGPQAFTFENSVNWTPEGGDPISLRPFPANLLRLLLADGQPVAVSVETRETGKPYLPGGTPLDAGTFQWATQIELSVREIPGSGAAPLKNTYGLSGANQEGQAILEEIIKLISPNDNSALKLTLLYQEEADAAGLISKTVDPSDVFVLRTNTTTVSVPPPSNDMRLAEFEDDATTVSVGATIGEQFGFLQIIQQASVTNAPGYFLYYEANDGTSLPSKLFTKGPAPITLLIEFSASSPTEIQPYYNSIALNDAVESALYYAETTNPALEIQYPAAAPGSVGANLTRDESQMGADDTPQRQLNNLYSLINYAIERADGYIASNLSSPIQPQQPVDGEEDDTINNYRVFAPLYKVADANQVLPATELPNRYASLAKPFDVQFYQTDAFGNLAPKVLNFTGNNLYFDPIVPLDQWQGVITDYNFLVDKASKANSFSIYLRPNKATFDNLSREPGPDGGGSETDVARNHFQTILDQITGPGVSFYGETNLALNTDGTMQQVVWDSTTAEYKAIVQMVTDIIDYLDGTDPGYEFAPVPLVVTTTAAGTLPSVFEIGVAFGIQRDDKYISPLIKDEKGRVTYLAAQNVASNIVAGVAADVEGEPGINLFASNFSKAYPVQSLAVGLNGAKSPQQQSVTSLARATLKASGTPSDGTGDSQSGPQSVWAVNRKLLNFKIGASKGTGPYYASPKPLNNQLQSGSVSLENLLVNPLPQPPSPKTFTGVDMDLFNRQFFTAVDTILKPSAATAVFQASPDSYKTIADGRRQIANKYSEYEINWLFDRDEAGNPSPFVPPAADQGEYLKKAQEAFGQQMRAALMTAYAVDTIVQYGVTWDVTPPSDVDDTIALFGPVREVVPAGSGANDGPDGAAKNSGLSTAKLQVTSEGPGLLTFLYGTPSIELESEVELDLEFRFTHLEYYLAPSDQTPENEARPSMWLQLVNPYEDAPHIAPEGESTTIPLIYRDYPTPPTIISQSGVADNAAVTITQKNLNEAAQWTYDYVYQGQITAHDRIKSEITYNTNMNPDDGALMRDAFAGIGPFTLFEALARFTAAQPILTPILTKPGSENWQAAVESLAEIVNQVVLNTDWNTDARMAMVGLQNITDHYLVTDQPVESQAGAREMILSWETTESTFATSISMQALDPALKPYPDQRKGTGTNEITNTYTPVPELTNDYVTHQVSWHGLNVLAAENATAGLQIQRNVIEMAPPGGGTKSLNRTEFTYTTGLVSFSSPVTPYIVNDTPIDIAQLPDQQPVDPDLLSNRILTLLSDLLNHQAHVPALLRAMADCGQGDSAPRRVKVQSVYQYPILSGDGTVPAKPLTVNVPVLLARSFDIDPQSDQLDHFSTEYAAALDAWSASQNIAYGMDSKQPTGTRFVFDITLYALLSGTNTPLLELQNLQLDLKDIAPIK